MWGIALLVLEETCSPAVKWGHTLSWPAAVNTQADAPAKCESHTVGRTRRKHELISVDSRTFPHLISRSPSLCLCLSIPFTYLFLPLHFLLVPLIFCECAYPPPVLSLLWLPLYHQRQEAVCLRGFCSPGGQVKRRGSVLVGITVKAASVRNRRCTRSVRTLPGKQLGMSAEQADQTHMYILRNTYNTH